MNIEVKVEDITLASEVGGTVRRYNSEYDEALGTAGVQLGEVRGHIAAIAVDALMARRIVGGMRSMLRLAQGTPEDRAGTNRVVVAGRPSSYTQATHAAIDAAVKAAAEVLADGKD